MGWIFFKPKYEKLDDIDKDDLNNDPGAKHAIRSRNSSNPTIYSCNISAQLLWYAQLRLRYLPCVTQLPSSYRYYTGIRHALVTWLSLGRCSRFVYMGRTRFETGK